MGLDRAPIKFQKLFFFKPPTAEFDLMPHFIALKMRMQVDDGQFFRLQIWQKVVNNFQDGL